jgi:hypothetical protein
MSDKDYFIEFWTPTLGAEEAERSWAVKQSTPALQPSMVMGDISPYKSMATGEMITSRSQHREHLKRHSLIEIGNETKYLAKKEPIKPPPGLRDTIARTVYQKLR